MGDQNLNDSIQRKNVNQMTIFNYILNGWIAVKYYKCCHNFSFSFHLPIHNLISLAMSSSSTILILLLSSLLVANNASPKPEEYQTYIIHMDRSQKPASFSTHESWHRST